MIYKIINKIRIINNYISSYWLIVLYGSVFWAYLKIGRIPRYDFPDPKKIFPNFELLFYMFTHSTIFITLGVFLNFLYLINCVKNRKYYFDKSIYFFIINLVLFFLVINKDPIGALNWFMD